MASGEPSTAAEGATVEAIDIELAGEAVRLTAGRGLYWPAERTLFAADLHWGKAAAFRAAAVPVPDDTERDLDRLGELIRRTGAERLIVLGDLTHARSGITPRLIDTVSVWRRGFSSLEFGLVRGNHDRGPTPAAWGVQELDEPTDFGPFTLRHTPAEPDGPGYVLAGHVHPAVTLHGPGRQREKLPCFWLGPRAGLLPAFGSFTGTAAVRPAAGDRVFVVADGQIVAVPTVPRSVRRGPHAYR